jgi:hypothetical protein
MEELKAVLDLMPEAKRSLGLAALERQTTLKALRKKVAAEGFEDLAQSIDDELELLKGTKEKRGLFFALEVQEEQKAKKKAEAAVDPAQQDIEDKPDYRTWDLNTDGVRELVSAEISANPPVAAVRILNALEDGERERKPKQRESVLQVIRDARAPLARQVDNLAEKAH